MKPKLTIFLLFALVAIAYPQSPAGGSGRSPVIVELFTSEGCSSCPPADSLLKKLETAQPVAGAEAIVLEEHVDYWNHQGWVDPFSSAQWTSRQAEYVSRFKVDGGAYTPEMVVNGETELVGSNEGKAEAAIANAARAGETTVSISAQPAGGGVPRFTVRVGKLSGGTPGDSAEVWLVVSEDGLQSSVRGGENAGRHLVHAAVLRSLHKIGDVKPSGAFEASPEVKLKPEWKSQNLQVVVFVQEKKSRKILGSAATRATG